MPPPPPPAPIETVLDENTRYFEHPLFNERFIKIMNGEDLEEN